MTGLEFTTFAVVAIVFGLCLCKWLVSGASEEPKKGEPPADFSDPNLRGQLRSVIEFKPVRGGSADKRAIR